MRIPFEIPNATETDEAAGFVYLEDDYLVFDVHILKWGVTRGDQEIVKAERGLIGDIRTERGLFKDRLFIETHSVKLLKAIPGPHVTEIVLKTKKRYRREVAAFVEQVLAWIDARPA